MANRHPRIEGGQRRREAGRRIALNEHEVGRLRRDHLRHAGQDPGGKPIERLVWRHDVEVVIRDDAEQVQHLVQHAAVLRRGAGAANDAGHRTQFQNDRR